MRRLVCTTTATLLALAPVSARPHGQGADHVVGVTHPIFGPSVHLLDPSLYPPSDQHYALQPLPDAEPSIAIAPDGTVWVAAIHMHDGTALWRGRFGQALPAVGRSTVYLSYMRRDENVLSGHMTVQRSDDGGRTWHPVGDPLAGLAAQASTPVHGWPGTLVVDRSGAVYEVFVTDGPGQPS